MTERWNLQRLWDFFRTGGPGFNQEALGAYVHTMTALLFGRLEIGWGTILPPAFDSALGALTLGQIALLGPVSVWASRRGRHFHAALALIALIGSLAAFWSLGQVRGPILDHLVFWVSALSVINYTVILAVVTSQGWDYLRARQLFPHGVHRWLVSPWLPALLIVVAASYYLPQLSRHQTRLGAGSLVVKSMFVDLKFHLDHHHVERPMFRIAPRAWGAAAGVILELSKARQQFFIEPFWAFMFTRAYLPDGTEDAEFDIVDSSRDKMKFLLTYEPVARAGDFSIYRQLSLGTSRRLTDPVRIVGTVGTRGNAVDVVDGRIPPNGADWNAAGTLQFDGRSSSITFVVPPTANGIALSADGNDSWRFECSADGATFEFAGIVPVQQGPGLQTREVHFRAPIPCRQLRLSPETGDGSFSMGEVTFLATPFTRGLSR
jgi:hypothetical protein